jgi:non-homologous end joining protein Ku
MTKLDTLTINEFVPLADIPWERGAGVLLPRAAEGQGARDARDAARRDAEQGVAGVAKLMPKSRQKLALIYPKHGGLMVTCLAYPTRSQQVVEGAAAISASQVNPKVLELTEKLIDLMTAPVRRSTSTATT